MNLLRTNFSENPNIGLYGFASNSYCIIGPKLKSEKMKEIADTLEVDILQTKIDGTDLPGIFLTGTEDFLLVSASIKEREKEKLRKLDTKIIELETRFNAFGNNILIGKDKIMINPRFKRKTVKKLGEATGYKVKKFKLADTGIVGANGVIVKDKGLLNPDVPEQGLKKVGKILKTKFDYGTVNFGSGFLNSGLIINEKGVVVGDRSTGPEISRIMEHFEDE